MDSSLSPQASVSAHPFNKAQKIFTKAENDYIIYLKEELDLTWEENSKRFNQQFPESPRTKGGLQVQYSRTLQPSKRQKSAEPKTPTFSRNTSDSDTAFDVKMESALNTGDSGIASGRPRRAAAMAAPSYKIDERNKSPESTLTDESFQDRPSDNTPKHGPKHGPRVCDPHHATPPTDRIGFTKCPPSDTDRPLSLHLNKPIVTMANSGRTIRLRAPVKKVPPSQQIPSLLYPEKPLPSKGLVVVNTPELYQKLKESSSQVPNVLLNPGPEWEVLYSPRNGSFLIRFRRSGSSLGCKAEHLGQDGDEGMVD